MKTSQKTQKGGVLKELKKFGGEMAEDVFDIGKKSVGDLSSQIFNDASSFQALQNDPRSQFGGNPFGSADNMPFGSPESFGPLSPFGKAEKKEPKRPRKIEMVFNYLEHQKTEQIVGELQGFINQARQELAAFGQESQAMVKDASRLVLQDYSNKKAGIYDVRFVQFIIRVLQNARQDISKASMWLQSGFNKAKAKKFRGRAKKLGTQFSMSKELTQANMPG